MRVCIFTETYYPVVGGGETQARLLAQGFAQKGIPVLILTRRSDSGLKRIERVDDAIVCRVGPTGTGQLKKWGLLFFSIPMLIRMRHRYDLIFVSGFRIVGVCALAVAWVSGKACVLKADSQGEMSGDFFTAGLARLRVSRHGWLFRTFLRMRNRVLRRADAFVAITEDMVREFVASGIRPKSIQLIPNAVDTDRFIPVGETAKRELRRRLSLPETGTIATYTGRLVSYKGIPLLLRVWRDIAVGRTDLVLVLVGTGGLDIHNCEHELRDYVAANGLEAGVRFAGSVDNVQEYLQASDVFVFPTENDAFPSSLVEAMACALPVVATPIGAIGSIVQHRENGLLVPARDGKALKCGLSTLLTDRALAGRLGEAARRSVRDRYSATSVSDRYARLFETVIAAGGGLK